MFYPITKPVRTTAPTALQEPVTLAEAKWQCGVAADNGYNDEHIQGFIASARELVEDDTGIVCFTGSYTWKLTHWPDDELFEIRCLRPVTSITSIAYLDGAGASQTWGAGNYSLETSTVVPLVRVTYGNTWPSIRGDTNGITVTLVAGYATVAAIPALVKAAVRFDIERRWWESQGDMAKAKAADGGYERVVAKLARRTYP